jgi:hypothetical protein
MLIRLTRIITHIPVFVSPAPRSDAIPAAEQASNGVTIKTIRKKVIAASAETPERFIIRTIEGAVSHPSTKMAEPSPIANPIDC